MDRILICRISTSVSLKGEYQGAAFDERQLTFILGEGSEANIPYGVEKALFKFSEGEKSLLTLGPKYAFGSVGSKEYKIPPDATIKYVVELHSFERVHLSDCNLLYHTACFQRTG